ncbi:MAG TPA: condensation domain-containing protein [Solirubrobacteraceae bacterium]
MSGEGYVFPLSFAQRRLWFLDQLIPGHAMYNLTATVQLAALDREALERALAAVVRRHEALRTTFRLVDGEPRQVVAPELSVPLRVVAVADEEHATRVATEEARRPFDLERGPLLRAMLLETPNSAFLVLTLHHIVADGWSLGVLYRDLSALYGGAELPGLPVQYADYAVWQQEWLAGGVLDEQLAHWRAQLEGLTELELPSDRPRPASPTFAGARQRLTLAADVDGLSRREGVTPFMTLLAAFLALLSRYSGQDDIAVGTPIANRTRAEIEPLIGFFVNTLVMRADLSGDPTFRELLSRVRDVALDAYANQDLPFERLVAELAPERDAGRNPLVDVMFQLQAAGAEPALATERGTSPFDLTCDLWPSGDGYAGHLEYSTERFDAGTIERLAGHYANLLAAAVDDPRLRVSELPLLGEDERERLLVTFNRTDAEVPDRRVDELVPYGDAIAVVDGDRRLTYTQLHRRANALAYRLHGAGPFVAIALGRSAELVVAALAVLKAGAAYAPLDPGAPPARRRLVLDDLGDPVVIEQVGDEEADAPPSGEGDLAYVIHTSGSTGRPKGVQIEHRSLANLVAWHNRAYGLEPGDRTTLLAAPSFDASVWELWPTLVAGATLHVVRDPVGLGPDGLRASLARNGITVSFLPTPLAEAVLAGPWPAGLKLRALLTGGDTLRRVPDGPLPFRLVNHYGPTEATVVATAGDVIGGERPSIGAPIANTRAYVLDRHGRPAPIGVPGELYLAGAGLARGYLNDPELTARSFVDAGERLYRTGDRVRRRPDGTLEFLGRLDRQVKVRGQRIELGEVEHALASHPGVTSAVALLREDELVAYVTPAALDAAQLRRHVAERLPAAMVPAAVVALAELPLTAHGKVDRARLPAPVLHSQAPVPPRTPLEAALVELWRDVLGRARVGIEDNFFELGGHSLSATELMSRVRGTFGVELPLRRLFDEPTVAALAEAIVEATLDDLDALGDEEAEALLGDPRARE